MNYPKINLSESQKNEVNKFNTDNKISYLELNCISCDTSNYKDLYNNDRYGIYQKTVMCNNCGLVYSNPRMNEKSLKYFYSTNLYRELYENVNDFEHGYMSRSKEIDVNIQINKTNFEKYYPQLFVDFISDSNINYNSVCELGAGFGNNLIYFNKLGKKTFGLEPSIKLTKIAIDNQINIKQGFVYDLKENYDIIIMKHVLEHLYDPVKDLKKIKEHTNKYLFIEVPGNIRRIASIQNAHNFYFTKNTLNKIVYKSGFNLIKSSYCKDTEFIFALYEKANDEFIKYDYDYVKEVNKIKKIYKNDNIRFFISKTLKYLQIYNLLKPLRKLVLKLLKFEN